MPHVLNTRLLNRAVSIHVIGCGGTGSQLLPGLVSLHKTMIALGHPEGLDVTVWDDDTVAEHNCIRQNFFPVDVTLNKAEVMVNRLNIAYASSGVHWHAKPTRFHAEAISHLPDFIIGCVDSTSARAGIHAAITSFQRESVYWLDCGNKTSSGQFIAGQWDMSADQRTRLPLVSELFPEIVGAETDEAPSCSAIQSIQRQGVVTNRFAATLALAWLDEALRQGSVDWCGTFFNLKSGRVTPVSVDPEAWARMGWHPEALQKLDAAA